MSVKISGMEELLEMISTLGDKADSVIDTALKQAAKNTADEIRDRAPYRTGQLRESVEVGEITGLGKNKTISVGFTNEGYYAKWHEFGSSKQSAKPFIEPSYLATKKENEEIISRAIRSALEQ
jgi:HK97 gp10 family phage protein